MKRRTSWDISRCQIHTRGFSLRFPDHAVRFRKCFIVLAVDGVYRRTGFGVLVKDIMTRMDHIIADERIRVIQIIHFIIVA